MPILATGLTLGYLLIISIPAITRSGTETGPTTHQPAVTQSHAVQTPQDFSLIRDFHLFGHPAGTSESPDGLPPETTLQIKLKGVFYLADKHAHAIIESPDQLQKAYKINDTLPGGAVLQAIENNRIVLMTNNRQESLTLNKTNSGQPASADTPAEPQPAYDEPAPESPGEVVIQPPESLAN